MRSETQRQALLAGLLRLRTASIVSRDGSLIGNLTAAENVALPGEYHATSCPDAVITSLLNRCGLIDKLALQVLLGKFPEQMSAYERRLIGFMRAICVEPELLVFDEIYDGLARLEVALVDKFDECFHLQFPFRTSVLLSFENAYRPTGSRLRTVYLEDEIE